MESRVKPTAAGQLRRRGRAVPAEELEAARPQTQRLQLPAPIPTPSIAAAAAVARFLSSPTASPMPLLTPPPPRARAPSLSRGYSSEPDDDGESPRPLSDATCSCRPPDLSEAAPLPPPLSQLASPAHISAQASVNQPRQRHLRQPKPSYDDSRRALGAPATSCHFLTVPRSPTASSASAPPANQPSEPQLQADSASLPAVLPSPLCPGRSFKPAQPASSAAAAAVSGRVWSGYRLFLLWQCIWAALLCCFVVFTLRPLQLQLRESIGVLDGLLAREPLTRPHPQSQPHHRQPMGSQLIPVLQHVFTPKLRRHRQSLDESAEPAAAHSSASGSRTSQPSSPPRSFWLLPMAEAASVPSPAASHAFSSRGSDNSDDNETEFDIFSADHLAAQYIVVYRDGAGADATDGWRNLTDSLVAAHANYVSLVAHFETLPGFACLLDTQLLADDKSREIDVDGSSSSRRRRHTLASLLASLRSHPAVLFVSQDHPLSIGTMGAAVQAGSIVPPGVRRILTGSLSTVAQAATVGVAVLDTGIDLTHPGLNAHQGINCISRIQQLTRAHRRRGNHRHHHHEGGEGEGGEELEDEDSTETDGEADASSSSFRSADHDQYDPYFSGDPLFDPVLAMDDNNHGTHVAGIIGGRNLEGSVVGVAPATPLYAVKILNQNGQGSWAHLLCGINWLTLNAERLNIKLASMSLAGVGTNDNACGERNSDALHKAICQSTKAGILFIAAAGNAGTDLSKVVPASYPEVLTVTAIADSDGMPGALGSPLTCRGVEDDDHVASFSNYALLPIDSPLPPPIDPSLNLTSDNPDWMHSPLLQDGAGHTLPITGHLLAAPGVCIQSTVREGGFGVYSGTSQACPHVTGIVALAYGSGDSTGPCHLLPPLECMALVVARAQDMERRARMGFGFLPWTTARATKKGQQAGTDEVLVRPGADLDADDDSEESGADDLDDAQAQGQEPPPQEGDRHQPQLLDPNGNEPHRATVRMRKYYGALVVGNLP